MVKFIGTSMSRHIWRSRLSFKNSPNLKIKRIHGAVWNVAKLLASLVGEERHQDAAADGSECPQEYYQQVPHVREGKLNGVVIRYNRLSVLYRGLETYEYEHGEWLLLLAAGLGVDPVDAVEEDLREEVVPLGGPDPGLARARGWVGGRVGLGHTHGWGQWSLDTASALLRGVFIFISVLWRPSPQCPSVAQPLCPQTCRHADTTGRYGTSWIFATLVYSMNAIKRLHI